LNNPHKGLNIIEGLLENSEGDILTISYKEKTRTIKIDLNVNNILKARLAFKF
ncbi:MAG: ribosome maturation factor, partial [Erysipelotrichia bacterium]|nr:ribosome maturation factor [Erysipelotrichia bacterium]